LTRFLSSWHNVLALLIVAAIVLAAILAPLLAPPDDPGNSSAFRVVGKSYDQVPRPPSAEALLGTAPGQLDVYHTLIWGTRSALRFGLSVALATACIGILIGAIGGYFGGAVNGVLMRLTDAFLAFPTIAAVLLFYQIMMPASPWLDPTPFQQSLIDINIDPVFVALILFSWMPYARLTSVNIVQLKQTEYMQAAVAVGAPRTRLIGRHLLPNALSPVVVLVARDVGAVVIMATAFTYVGLGNSTEWGTLLVNSRDYIIGSDGNPLRYWWVFLPVTLALVLFGVGWNLLGDGLNDLLNPRVSR
jgi:peptide/nickel transport system permease protein